MSIQQQAMPRPENHAQVEQRMREWIEKAVIGLNLCPFVHKVYQADQVRLVISHARHLDGLLEDLDQELDHLASTPAEQTETTLLVHPALLADFADFNEVIGIAEEAVTEHGLEGIIQVAGFHPQFCFADTAEDAIENYANRAPYPTFHLIRESSLTEAISSYPDPEQICQRNTDTLRNLGLSGWLALFDKTS